MLAANAVFLENLEWFDETGKHLVYRLPQEGSGEIKWGAQLTVRESQAAIFFSARDLHFSVGIQAGHVLRAQTDRSAGTIGRRITATDDHDISPHLHLTKLLG